ncbi:phage major tail tube protein [Kaistia sp. MMO-174]|uniref:phage major tail tube protein n=1 Tax=Kaistia sp. MMO-174 TaxID=3081256 RepID=UPI003018379B
MEMNSILHGWNLFADGVPQSLVAETAQLPSLEESTRDFTPGGGHMGFAVPLSAINAVEIGFNLVNRSPQLLSLFGLNAGQYRTYTLYENLVDEFTGDTTRRVVTAIGRLSSVESQEHKSPDLVGYQYRVRSIHTYTDVFDGRLINGFYFRTNRRIINGVDVTATRNGNLGI